MYFFFSLHSLLLSYGVCYVVGYCMEKEQLKRDLLYNFIYIYVFMWKIFIELDNLLLLRGFIIISKYRERKKNGGIYYKIRCKSNFNCYS